MKTLILITILVFTNTVFAQTLSEPKLLGTWRLEFYDFDEFIYHKIEAVKFSYLKDNPNGKVIARICSKHKTMPQALIDSVGFAFSFPGHTKYFQIPNDKVFFARYSKCGNKSEQYWFVPENTTLDYDEIILAEKVKVNRYSSEARKEFTDNTKKFIEELKNNPKAEGFIILNIQTKNRYLQKALQQIQKEKIDKSRFQILRKKIYQTNLPEFMTVSVDE
jgi:hypothetical protein